MYSASCGIGRQHEEIPAFARNILFCNETFTAFVYAVKVFFIPTKK